MSRRIGARIILKRYFVVAVIIVIFFLGAVHMPETRANPIPPPVDYSDATPYIGESHDYEDYNGNLSFVSERLVFVILDPSTARVDALYEFKNKGGEAINATIILPFVMSPDGLSMTIDGIPLEYWDDDIFNAPIQVQEHNLGSRVDAICFPVSLGPGESAKVGAKYKRAYESDTGFIKSHYSIKYISTTGALWPDPIEKAEFIFRIPKEMFSEKTKGKDFVKEESGNEVELTATYLSWVPKANIILEWESTDNGTVYTLYAMVIGVVVTVIVLFLVLRRRPKVDDRSGDGKKEGSEAHGTVQDRVPPGP